MSTTLTRSGMTVATTMAGYCLLLSGVLRLTIPIASTRVNREMWRMPREIPYAGLSSLHRLPPFPLSRLPCLSDYALAFSLLIVLGELPIWPVYITVSEFSLAEKRTSPKFNGRSTSGENDPVGHRYYGWSLVLNPSSYVISIEEIGHRMILVWKRGFRRNNVTKFRFVLIIIHLIYYYYNKILLLQYYHCNFNIRK